MRKTTLLIALLLIALLAPALAETSDLEITDLHVTSDGMVCVKWRDDLNAGPYQVLFQSVSPMLQNEDAPTNEVTVWCNSGDVEDTSYCEPYIAPDRDYWFILQAADGRQTWKKYEGEAQREYGWIVEFKPVSVYRSGNSISYDAIEQFQEEDLLAMDEKHSYGLEVTFYTDKSFPGSIPDGAIIGTLMLVADNIMGEPRVVAYANGPVGDGVALRADLGDWFRWLYEDSGIPSYDRGLFDVKAYLNGSIIGEEMFFIK